ncbi:MAG TPA: trehalase family glycosidase [Ktedonobacterales bacterium]
MTDSPFLSLLKNRITLDPVPFTERDSRILITRRPDGGLRVALAEYEREPSDNAPIPAWHFTGADGEPLACDYITYPHAVLCRTATGTFSITFLDATTLLVALPEGRSGIILQTQTEQARTTTHGGELQRCGASPWYLTYATNATLLQNEIEARGEGGQGIHRQAIQLRFDAAEGSALLLTLARTPTTRPYARPIDRLDIPSAALALAASEQRWHSWFAAAPPVAEEYQRQYYYAWWVMRVNLLTPYAHPARQGMVPSKLGYVGIWHWDSYFHAIALRHIDSKLAQDQIRILLDHQLESGQIPDVIHDTGVLSRTDIIVEADITKPPLTAWVVWKLYELDQDRTFLEEVYEPIVRSQNWWLTASDSDGNGLCEYAHPWSSGLDNSPLWDHGLPVETPDLGAYLCMQYDYLSKIAAELGRDEEAREWAMRAECMARLMIALRWDEDAGYFHAVQVSQAGREGTPSVVLPVRTPFQLFPLITGRMPEAISRRLVDTLTDERQFWGRHPVPTVALDDPSFDPHAMWRGPVWLNVNYLLIDGLQRAGYDDEAHELRARTLALALAADDFYEYYSPVSGERPPGATYAFGWSAALFIDLAIAASRELVAVR